MKTVEQYLESLRQRKIRLFIKGEQIPPEDIVDHPMIAPSIRTIAESYRLANIEGWQDLMTAHSSFIDGRVNRFTHIFEQPDDLLKKNQDAACSRTHHRDLFSALRGDGCYQCRYYPSGGGECGAVCVNF